MDDFSKAPLRIVVVRMAQINVSAAKRPAFTLKQSTAREEGRTAKSRMDERTSQNAAPVEETTAASQTLAQETSRWVDE